MSCLLKDLYIFCLIFWQPWNHEQNQINLQNSSYFLIVWKKGNETDGKIKVSMNEELIKKSLELAGYNLLVTSEISMSDKDVYDAYHNLWRIEESFRIMKSQLDARPVYLQKKDTIIGHFLICYLAVLLTRLLQFKLLKSNYCSEDLFDFVHDLGKQEWTAFRDFIMQSRFRRKNWKNFLQIPEKNDILL